MMPIMTGNASDPKSDPPQLPAHEEKLRTAMTNETSDEALVLSKSVRTQRQKKVGPVPSTTFQCSTQLAGLEMLLRTADR